jgi:Icc-related predicted phosphoesterase
MNFLILADDDGIRHGIEPTPADVLVSCGDLADLVILEAAKTVRSAHILAVKGNHDSGAPFPQPIVDLHLATVTINGVTFGGFNGSWKYKPRGHYLYEQFEVERLLATFPMVDVFVAHNSPRGIHERDTEVHVGFDAFAGYIERAQPRLFIHGHQHVNQETQLGSTRIIGVYGQMRLDWNK